MVENVSSIATVQDTTPGKDTSNECGGGSQFWEYAGLTVVEVGNK
jgi:hypothetical protein